MFQISIFLKYFRIKHRLRVQEKGSEGIQFNFEENITEYFYWKYIKPDFITFEIILWFLRYATESKGFKF